MGVSLRFCVVSFRRVDRWQPSLATATHARQGVDSLQSTAAPWSADSSLPVQVRSSAKSRAPLPGAATTNALTSSSVSSDGTATTATSSTSG